MYARKLFAFVILIVGLLLGCAPQLTSKGVAMTNNSTGTDGEESTLASAALLAAEGGCPLALKLENFNQLDSSVSADEAVYRVALNTPLRELVTAVYGNLKSNGWQFAGADKTNRADNTYLASYTCPANEDAQLNVSIRPIGRSLIYVVRLTRG